MVLYLTYRSLMPAALARGHSDTPGGPEYRLSSLGAELVPSVAALELAAVGIYCSLPSGHFRPND
jgi:hypothetical protein